MFQRNLRTFYCIYLHRNPPGNILSEVQNRLPFRAMKHFLNRKSHYRNYRLPGLGMQVVKSIICCFHKLPCIILKLWLVPARLNLICIKQLSCIQIAAANRLNACISQIQPSYFTKVIGRIRRL